MLVGLYITAAYWFTASTSFANPAVAIARSLTNTFAGIRPIDLTGFILAQIAGALIAAAAVVEAQIAERQIAEQPPMHRPALRAMRCLLLQLDHAVPRRRGAGHTTQA